jgi:hypothetical protein
MKFGSLNRFLKNIQISKKKKKKSWWETSISVQTDGRTDVMKLIVTYRMLQKLLKKKPTNTGDETKPEQTQ